jgi:hypothetical protein
MVLETKRRKNPLERIHGWIERPTKKRIQG